jgi:hypothetical protein
MFFESAQRLHPVGGLDNSVAEFAKRLGRVGANIIVVFYDKDRFRTTSARRNQIRFLASSPARGQQQNRKPLERRIFAQSRQQTESVEPRHHVREHEIRLFPLREIQSSYAVGFGRDAKTRRLQCFVGELSTVHSIRQPDIREQQRNIRVLPKADQSCARVVCGNDEVASPTRFLLNSARPRTRRINVENSCSSLTLLGKARKFNVRLGSPRRHR